MGGGITTYLLDVSNNSSSINRRNPIFNDIWGRGCNSSGHWLSNVENNAFTSDGNDELLEKSLDLIEERRENATVQLAYYQHKLKQGYDTNVKLRPLSPKDLVLRKVLGTTKNPAWGKFWHNWEGPYRITSMAGIGVYYLEDLDEKTVLHPWNVNNLKRYYY